MDHGNRRQFIIDPKEVNQFLDQTVNFFSLKKGESQKKCQGTKDLKWLREKIFVCRFLYDCIGRGSQHHRDYVKEQQDELVKQVDEQEAQKYVEAFFEMRDNREMVTILAYEFFIHYIARMVEAASGVEAEDDLRVSVGFWMGKLKGLQVWVPQGERHFWNAFSIWRNAYSHLNAKKYWADLVSQLDNTSFVLWLYGLLHMAYNIDQIFHEKHSLPQEEINLDLQGKPVFDFGGFEVGLK